MNNQPQAGKYIVEVNSEGKIISQPVLYTAVNEKVIEIPKFIPYETSTYIYLGIFVAIAMLFILKSFFIVKQQTVKIIERFGKFKEVATSGLNFKIPFIDRVAKTMDMRVQQMDVELEAKTKDNVFSVIRIAVQYLIISEKASDAFYKLDNPVEQMTAYVSDVVRSEIPKLTLDESFEKKNDLAIALKNELSTTMDDYGYKILTALVVDIEPASNVKESMNNINSAQRDRVASNEKGEAEKILVVKKAEADALSMKLKGEGIANQRRAIVEGLKESVDSIKEATGLNSDVSMRLVLMTQYFDTLKDMGANKTVFMNHSPSAVNDFSDEIKRGMMSANEIK